MGNQYSGSTLDISRREAHREEERIVSLRGLARIYHTHVFLLVQRESSNKSTTFLYRAQEKVSDLVNRAKWTFRGLNPGPHANTCEDAKRARYHCAKCPGVEFPARMGDRVELLWGRVTNQESD